MAIGGGFDGAVPEAGIRFPAPAPGVLLQTLFYFAAKKEDSQDKVLA